VVGNSKITVVADSTTTVGTMVLREEVEGTIGVEAGERLSIPRTWAEVDSAFADITYRCFTQCGTIIHELQA